VTEEYHGSVTVAGIRSRYLSNMNRTYHGATERDNSTCNRCALHFNGLPFVGGLFRVRIPVRTPTALAESFCSFPSGKYGIVH
jgi:hypothetical protein